MRDAKLLQRRFKKIFNKKTPKNISFTTITIKSSSLPEKKRGRPSAASHSPIISDHCTGSTALSFRAWPVWIPPALEYGPVLQLGQIIHNAHLVCNKSLLVELNWLCFWHTRLSFSHHLLVLFVRFLLHTNDATCLPVLDKDLIFEFFMSELRDRQGRRVPWC